MRKGNFTGKLEVKSNQC